MNQITNFFGNIFNGQFINSILEGLKFIIKLPQFIIEQLSFLPIEILVPLTTVIFIAIGAFLYKFFK